MCLDSGEHFRSFRANSAQSGIVLYIEQSEETRKVVGSLEENDEIYPFRKIYHLDVRMSQNDDSLCTTKMFL